MRRNSGLKSVQARGARAGLVALLALALLPLGTGMAQAGDTLPAAPAEEPAIFGQPTAGTLKDTHPATVYLYFAYINKVSECSGAYVAPGKIITAKHCVNSGYIQPLSINFKTSFVADECKSVERSFRCTNRKSIKSIKRLDDYDMAIIETNDLEHPYAKLRLDAISQGETLLQCGRNYVSSSVRPTDWVDNEPYDYGSSLGDPSEGNRCGKVVAKWQSELKIKDDEWNKKWVFVSPMLNLPGDSGGPLYDANGAVVAITHGIITVESHTYYEYYGGITALNFVANQLRVPTAKGGPGLEATATAPGKTPLPYYEMQTWPAKPALGSWSRAAGRNRVLTSLAAWKATPGVKTVLLASGWVAADGLSATQLAGVTKGAVVLSMGKTSLDPVVLQQILSSGVKKVIRVGGTVGISSADIKKLQAAGVSVNYLGLVGKNRYDTAVKVARYRDSLAGKPPAGILVADGIDFPDALMAGAVAAKTGKSLVLTNSISNTVPRETAAYLREKAVGVAAVGGPAYRALQAAKIKSTPLVGASRYETALKLTSLGIDSYKRSTGQVPNPGLVFVTGNDFPDALSGGSLAVLSGRQLVMIPPGKRSEISRIPKIIWPVYGQNSVVVGGAGALSEQSLRNTLQ